MFKRLFFSPLVLAAWSAIIQGHFSLKKHRFSQIWIRAAQNRNHALVSSCNDFYQFTVNKPFCYFCAALFMHFMAFTPKSQCGNKTLPHLI